MGKKIKSSAKHGRNRKSGQNLAYQAEHRREKSHVARIRSHLERFGASDRVACDQFLKYAEQVGPSALALARSAVAALR